MSNVIHKYGPVYPRDGWQEIEMPEDATIVHFAEQPQVKGELFIWALVNPIPSLRVRKKIAVIGTGWDIPEDAIYVQTAMASDATVWHLFEEF